MLGAVCVPVSTHPPVLLLGHPLVTSSRDDVKSFLIHRALKVLQANAAAISKGARRSHAGDHSEKTQWPSEGFEAL